MSFRAPSPSRKIDQGFTLVEILVATAILVILLTMILSLTTQVGAIWRNSDGQKAGRKDARALLATISSDLKAALLPLHPSDQNNLQFLVNPAGLSDVNNRDCFFWQTELSRQGNQSDVVVVGYFVRWDTTSNPSKPVASLCRVYVQASDPNYPQSWNAWLNDSFLNVVAPGTLNPSQNNYKGLMAENVIGLWLSLWDSSGNPIPGSGTPIYDSRQTHNLPAVVEVALATLDPSTAAQLTTGDANTLAQMARSQPSSDAFLAACTDTGGSLAKIGRGLQIFRTRVFMESSQ